jgi:hypothetical protein
MQGTRFFRKRFAIPAKAVSAKLYILVDQHAYFFEVKIGKGPLLVVFLNLLNNRAESSYLLNELIADVDFHPAVTMTIKELFSIQGKAAIPDKK